MCCCAGALWADGGGLFVSLGINRNGTAVVNSTISLTDVELATNTATGSDAVVPRLLCMCVCVWLQMESTTRPDKVEYVAVWLARGVCCGVWLQEAWAVVACT